MKKPGIAVLLTLAAATLFAASSPTAKAPPGTDNVAFGYGAGYGSGGQNENVVCIGTDAGAFSSNNVGCVFIGADAGKGTSGATGRTVVNGQFCADAREDSFSIAPSPSAPLLPIEYRSGTLRENVDFKIETTAANRLAFENAVADVWLSAFDGSDANDGLSPTSAVKTIAGAYTAAYNGITNGTFNVSNEIVVAVAEGRYAPCVIYSALTNGIAYVATGDRKDTIIDGMMATNGTRALGSPHNRTVAVGVRMACPDILYSVSMRGFTLTGFNHYYHGSHDVRSQVIYGIKFSKCDFTANDAIVREDSAFASGIFDECDFHGNKLLCGTDLAVDAFFGGNSGWSIYGDDVILSRCHVWDNDMSICAYLIRSPSTRQKEVSHCLLEVDFYEYYGRPGGSYNTIIAKTLSNPHVTGLTHNKDGQFNTNSFIVVAEPGPGYTDSIYQVAGSCVVSNANLTADRVAADPSCPSVRSDGRRDYGYRDSGLGYETAFALRADIRFEDGALCVYTNGVRAGTVTFTPEAEEE